MFWPLYWMLVTGLIILWIRETIIIICMLIKLAFQIAWLCILLAFLALQLAFIGCKKLYQWRQKRLAAQSYERRYEHRSEYRWDYGDWKFKVEMLPPQR